MLIKSVQVLLNPWQVARDSRVDSRKAFLRTLVAVRHDSDQDVVEAIASRYLLRIHRKPPSALSFGGPLFETCLLEHQRASAVALASVSPAVSGAEDSFVEELIREVLLVVPGARFQRNDRHLSVSQGIRLWALVDCCSPARDVGSFLRELRRFEGLEEGQANRADSICRAANVN